MEALSQLDIQTPDHVSVITRDGRVTISVSKDGNSVTLGFNLKNSFDTTAPKPQYQQSIPVIREEVSTRKTGTPTGTTHFRYAGPIPKLTDKDVREIKMMLSDKGIMSKFRTKTSAYHEIGKAYKVSHCTISNIDRGISWRHVEI